MDGSFLEVDERRNVFLSYMKEFFSGSPPNIFSKIKEHKPIGIGVRQNLDESNMIYPEKKQNWFVVTEGHMVF